MGKVDMKVYGQDNRRLQGRGNQGIKLEINSWIGVW